LLDQTEQRKQDKFHPMTSLTFLGAARTVTGSKYLLDVDGRRILVDCGQFQGLADLRRRNWAAFPVDPSSVEAVVLTHAHIDHSGLLPRLVSSGFKGPIYCTHGTSDLLSLLLPDAGRLQEEDARLANRKRFSKHTPALPLFTEADAFETLTRVRVVPYATETEIVSGLRAEFINAGHLLGSAFVRISRPGGSGRVLFGGDLGRYNRPVLPDPQPAPDAETLLLESTYGNRVHPDADDAAALERIIDETVDRGGRLIIPAFAIGRVEELLYWLKWLDDHGRLPPVPIYVDSPMAVSALNFYQHHQNDLDPDVRSRRADICMFCMKHLQPVVSPQASRNITQSHGQAIVISASGMATGGRVLHHLAACLPDERNTVLFVGFQAEGTRGRNLVEGARTVKIHGQAVPVNARIARLDSMSAHADASEITKWLHTFTKPPDTTYLVHGEPVAMTALAQRIESTFGWRVYIPQHGEKVAIAL
jgi:metallo-beta-lactamase family protein